jgi:hypothetical protein
MFYGLLPAVAIRLDQSTHAKFSPSEISRHYQQDIQ